MNLRKLKEYYDGPEYLTKLRAKVEIMKELEADPYIRSQRILEVYSVDPVRFIEDFCLIPIAKLDGGAKPFFLWDYQKNIIRNLQAWEAGTEEISALVDKPREMGVTWTISAYFLWRYLFTPNYSAFILSRTEEEVDDGTRQPEGSIFSKIRWMHDRLPKYMIPPSYQKKTTRGTPTDMNLKLINLDIGSSLTGSSTNSNAGRSRRYTTTFVDEAFAIQGFNDIYRSLKSVQKVLLFASTVRFGKNLEDFKKAREAEGHYISLKWSDHPFKDQEWADSLRREAEIMNDPDLIREIEPTYAVSSKSQYYPGIANARLESFDYDPRHQLYISLDLGGKHDLTVLIFWQFDGVNLKCLSSYHNRNRPTDWYVPFMNPEALYNPEHYTEYQRKEIEKWRGRKKPSLWCGEADHFAARHPTNTSSASVLAKYGIRLVYNQYAIQHAPRRNAMEMLFPRMVFNRDDDGAMRVYDAIAQSRYQQTVRTVNETLKPIHDDEIADFRAAAENMAANFSRILRHNREKLSQSSESRDFHSHILKMLRI